MWVTDLYDGYAWCFRVAGLAVRGKLVLMLAVAVVTYVSLYALTTWLGAFA